MKTIKIYKVSTNGNFGGNAEQAKFTTKEKAKEFVGKMILDFGIAFDEEEKDNTVHYTSKEKCRISTPHHTEEGIWDKAKIRIEEDEELSFMDDEQFVPRTDPDDGYIYRPITREIYQQEKK